MPDEILPDLPHGAGEFPAFGQDIVSASEAGLDFVAQQPRPMLSAILRFGFVPPHGDQFIAWFAFDRFESGAP